MNLYSKHAVIRSLVIIPIPNLKQDSLQAIILNFGRPFRWLLSSYTIKIWQVNVYKNFILHNWIFQQISFTCQIFMEKLDNKHLKPLKLNL